MASDGTVYISDSNAGVIYRIDADDKVEKWLEFDAGLNPNGVCIDGGTLFVGLNPVHRIVAVDLDNRSVADHAVLPSGLVDGIEALGNGMLADVGGGAGEGGREAPSERGAGARPQGLLPGHPCAARRPPGRFAGAGWARGPPR